MNCSCVSVDRDLWKLKLFLPGTTVTRCYICEWLFKSCLMKIPKVTSLEYEPVYVCWSFKVKGFFPNKIATKCCICGWIYKSCLMKIHKVTAVEYEPVLCLLSKIFESWSCFSQTNQWQNVIFVNEFTKVVWSKSTKWLL